MNTDTEKHHRRSIRLKDYDYSQAGAYFFTIVAQHRACLFGNIVNGTMICNAPGELLWEHWNALPKRFPNIELDEFVVMPNHIHGILLIIDKVPRRGDGSSSPDMGQARGAAPTEHITHAPTLGNILGAWKSIVTNEYINGVRHKNWEPFDGKLLQRNYWEHIIRNERELDAIREYIINNPANWDNDDNNPANIPL